MSIKNGKGYKLLHAIDLIDEFSTGVLEKPKGQLGDIIDQLDPNDNPVIMIVDFK